MKVGDHRYIENPRPDKAGGHFMPCVLTVHFPAKERRWNAAEGKWDAARREAWAQKNEIGQWWDYTEKIFTEEQVATAMLML